MNLRILELMSMSSSVDQGLVIKTKSESMSENPFSEILESHASKVFVYVYIIQNMLGTA